MKIVAFAAANGPSEPAVRMAKLALQKMAEAGYETEIVYIGVQAYLPLCSIPSQNQPAETPSEEDFIASSLKKLKECDGFFIAAPVICGNLASSMAAFLERVSLASQNEEHFLRGKVGGMFTTSAHIGGMQAIYQVVNFFYTTEAVFTWARYWPMSWENEKIENPEADEEAMETIEDIGNQMTWLLRALA